MYPDAASVSNLAASVTSAREQARSMDAPALYNEGSPGMRALTRPRRRFAAGGSISQVAAPRVTVVSPGQVARSPAASVPGTPGAPGYRSVQGRPATPATGMVRENAFIPRLGPVSTPALAVGDVPGGMGDAGVRHGHDAPLTPASVGHAGYASPRVTPRVAGVANQQQAHGQWGVPGSDQVLGRLPQEGELGRLDDEAESLGGTYLDGASERSRRLEARRKERQRYGRQRSEKANYNERYCWQFGPFSCFKFRTLAE